MANPVWVLSVDLQTKTATFQSGLADAARTARGAFDDIGDGAKGMGQAVREGSGAAGYSMMEARHSVMILGEEFGMHLPRAISTAIASFGPLGAALEMAFPFLAIILGATLLIEHLKKIAEAAEAVEAAGRKMADGFAEKQNKVDQEIVNTEIEIRKLAGEPAWDLLAQKLRLEDAEAGMKNVADLEKELKELLQTAGATSNLNPFHWFDNSGDVTAKAKALLEQLHGKGQDDQAAILHSALTLQSHILEQMKQQGTASGKELENQQKYVDFLEKETQLIQRQADESVLKDQAKQGQDRAEKIRQEEQAQAQLYAEQQKGLNQRLRVEEEYYKKSKEAAKKALEDKVKDAELEEQANEAVAKILQEQAHEQAHISEELGKEEAEHTKRMAELKLQILESAQKDEAKLRKQHNAEIVATEEAGANAEFQAEMRGLQMQIGALDKSGKDYQVHLKQLQDKEEELTLSHENKITQIKVKAEEERNQRIEAAERKMQDDIAGGLTKVLMGHETFSKMMISLGDQVISGMMENAMKSIMANDMTKESDAAAAARKAFLAGWHFPFPANIVMAPVLGAAAFASTMAFAEGGIVPGVENFDSVNAKLTPGEGVIPKDIMEGLTEQAKHGGGMSSQPTVIQNHNHKHYHEWNTLDGASVDHFLDQHSDKLEKHMESVIRRRNA
jgi:hypothetical protein